MNLTRKVLKVPTWMAVGLCSSNVSAPLRRSPGARLAGLPVKPFTKRYHQDVSLQLCSLAVPSKAVQLDVSKSGPVAESPRRVHREHSHGSLRSGCGHQGGEFTPEKPHPPFVTCRGSRSVSAALHASAW
ncbi:uncharacterized protein WM277_002967 isoform 1-T3 [Molossus nigricans]